MKKVDKYLDNSQKVRNIAMPDSFNSGSSPLRTYYHTADKAGSCDSSCRISTDERVWRLSRELASFVISIIQIFSSQMPNSPKNLIADTIGVSASTVSARNSVSLAAILRKNYKGITFSLGIMALAFAGDNPYIYAMVNLPIAFTLFTLSGAFKKSTRQDVIDYDHEYSNK